MASDLSKLLANLNYNQLCSLCEDWTLGACDYCNEPVCDDCHDEHSEDHINEEQK